MALHVNRTAATPTMPPRLFAVGAAPAAGRGGRRIPSTLVWREATANTSGNVRSVALAFQRLGAGRGDAATADLAVLPAGLRRLHARARGRAVWMRLRERGRRAVLGICSLAAALTSPRRTAVSKAGIVLGAVRLQGVRDRWADVEPIGEEFYFAHSYGPTPAAATSEGIVAAAQHGSLTGCSSILEDAAWCSFLSSPPRLILPRRRGGRAEGVRLARR